MDELGNVSTNPRAHIATDDEIDEALMRITSSYALLDVPPPQHQLRDQIGASKGRVTCQEHLDRLDWTIKNVPFPSTAFLENRFMGKTAIIVGSGPSLTNTYGELRTQIERLGSECKVFAPNKAHDFLINGKRKGKKTWERIPIIPDFGVLCDPSDFVVTYQTPHPEVVYLLASMCDRRVFDKFMKAKARALVWAPVFEEDSSDIKLVEAKQYPVPIHFVSGGSTVGQRTMNIALGFGFKTVDLYGFDSCYAPGHGKTLYAVEKPVVVHEVIDTSIRFRGDGTFFRYRSNSHMAKQAMEFDDMLDRLPALKANGIRRQMQVRIHGDGLLPWLSWKCSGPNTLIQHATPEKMQAKYGNQSWDYVEDRPMTDAEIAFWQAHHNRRAA